MIYVKAVRCTMAQCGTFYFGFDLFMRNDFTVVLRGDLKWTWPDFDLPKEERPYEHAIKNHCLGIAESFASRFTFSPRNDDVMELDRKKKELQLASMARADLSKAFDEQEARRLKLEKEVQDMEKEIYEKNPAEAGV